MGKIIIIIIVFFTFFDGKSPLKLNLWVNLILSNHLHQI